MDISRRNFGLAAATTATAGWLFRDEKDKKTGPRETSFTRDYEPPKFKPSWDKPQINRELVSDFVIFAHSDLEMVKKLYDREPGLLNAVMDWGGGRLGRRDWRRIAYGAQRHREILVEQRRATQSFLCGHDGYEGDRGPDA